MRIIAAGLRPPSVAADAPWARESPLPVTAADAAAAARAEREQRRREAASSPAADRSADATPAEPDPPVELETLLAVVPARPFVLSFMLQAGAAATRHEACAAFRGLWHHATAAQRAELFGVLRDQLASLPLYGANSAEVLALLTAMVRAPSGTPGLDDDMTSAVVDALAASLGEQNALLADHPNAFVYNSLGGLLDLEGHFLESEAAHASNQPELPTQQAKLDTLKAEVKFTEACQIYKFSAPQTVSAGVLRVSDMRRGVSVASINLYCNNRTVTDVGELKNKWEVWKRVKTLHLAPAQAEVRFEFTIPIVAANFLVEYATFHEPHGAGGEKLQCPRCSRTVTDKHGICNHCGDNAYQCRHCRNINYEKLDAFLCNECGFCKFARFEFTLTVRPSYVVERVTTEAQAQKLLALIDAELLNANKRYAQLSSHKVPLERLLAQLHDGPSATTSGAGPSSGGGGGGSDPSGVGVGAESLVAALPIPPALRITARLLCSRCSTAASRRARTSRSRARRRSSTPHASSPSATCRAPPPARSRAPPRPPTTTPSPAAWPSPPSPGTAAGGARRQPAVRLRVGVRAAVPRLLRGARVAAGGARGAPPPRPRRRALRAQPRPRLRHTQLPATRLLCALSHESADATAELGSLLSARLDLCLAHYPQLPTDSSFRRRSRSSASSARSRTTLWCDRLRLLVGLFFRGLKHLHSAFICERVVLPCLKTIVRLSTPPNKPPAPPPTAVRTPRRRRPRRGGVCRVSSRRRGGVGGRRGGRGRRRASQPPGAVGARRRWRVGGVGGRRRGGVGGGGRRRAGGGAARRRRRLARAPRPLARRAAADVCRLQGARRRRRGAVERRDGARDPRSRRSQRSGSRGAPSTGGGGAPVRAGCRCRRCSTPSG